MKEKYWIEQSIKINLYPGKINIIFTNDADKTRSVFNEIEFEEIFAHSIKMHSGRLYTIILNFDHKSKITHGTIAHEAIHIAYYIFEHIGIKLDLENPEVLTYLVHWIVNEIYKMIKKNNFTIK